MIVGTGCVEPGPCQLDARPTTIDEALDTIERLPSPVTLSCFLESLDRPLGLQLTSDVFSAQPAQGVRSPRMFVQEDTLSMSIVPVGVGRDLLEFGEVHETGLTIKAELHFPVELPLAPEAPFERVLDYPGADRTGCQVCHFEEIEIRSGVFASTPLRPPPRLVVPLEVLEDEHAGCSWGDDPYRCEMFSALLDHGPVEQVPFPEGYPTLTAPL